MKLLWLDLETTGLDPKQHEILEVGAVLTDENLVELGRFHQVCKMPEPYTFDEAALLMHKQGTLLEECEEKGINIYYAELNLIEFLFKATGYVKEPIYLAGSSIHFDRSFLKEHMKTFEKKLHHKMLDVSSIRIMMSSLGITWKKKDAHRSIPDIEESIAEYKFYKNKIYLAVYEDFTL